MTTGTQRSHITLIIDEDRCQVCDECLAKRTCKGNAIRIIDKGEAPFLDMSRCWGCMVCITTCEYNAVVRRDEATREMRRLVNDAFGREALRWFDAASEEWRGYFSNPRLRFGAWFGSAYDRDGLYASKVYYELGPGQDTMLPPALGELIRTVLASMPRLVPVFTTLSTVSVSSL